MSFRLTGKWEYITPCNIILFSVKFLESDIVLRFLQRMSWFLGRNTKSIQGEATSICKLPSNYSEGKRVHVQTGVHANVAKC